MSWTNRKVLSLAGLVALAITPAVAVGVASASAASAGCIAISHIDSQWATGQIVSVTVTNTASTSATKWTATGTLASGQSVASAWSATVTPSGSTITAVNMSYNGALAPGASTSFGMQLNGVGPAPVFSCANDTVAPVTTSALPPTSNPPLGADVTVTETSVGQTVTLKVGQTLGVSLPPSYDPTTLGGTALTRVSTSGGYPTKQRLSELYRAVAAGVVDLQAAPDFDCLHTTPGCTLGPPLWRVRVVVVSSAVTLTEADSGSTVTVKVGQTVAVSLGAEYRPTTVSGPALVLVSTSGGYPTGQPLAEYYRAQATGSVDLSTMTEYACLHTTPRCTLPQRLWRVHVNVVS